MATPAETPRNPEDRQAAAEVLAGRVTSIELTEEEIRRRLTGIHEETRSQSNYIREPNFTVIHPRDLARLFDAYDQRFFDGLLRRAVGQQRLEFRLSRRMTRAGGKTSRFRNRDGEHSFEIAVAASMLFEGFGAGDREASVAGVPCGDRLEALQRILEHELIHLTEFLCWNQSNCAAARFQDIAARLFLHRSHTHELVTRREKAAESGIVPGSRVSFAFEGRRLTGRVNRITKRATVLVEDPDGVPYSDGRRYHKYYVPVEWLELVEARPAGA